jgi:allophanate hydrolase
MTIRVAINGYGRIGRNILRAHYEGGKKHDIQIVAINDLGDPKTNAHLTQYDTTHGKFPGTVTVDGDSIVVNGDRIKVLAQRNPAELPWGELKVDVVLGDFFDTNNAAIHPVVRDITTQADKFNAVDAFNGQYRLAELRREAENLLQNTDLLLVPTTTTMPTIAAVEADPVVRNSQLGYYTNFVNLMDMAALAIPAVWRKDGLPAGITLIGPAGSDHLLAEAGAQFQQLLGGAAQADAVAAAPLPFNEPTIKVGVVGAHLSGQPLNWQLLEAGARLHASTTTSRHYRLYALANTTPAKPGLVRINSANDDDGAAIISEVWEMPLRNFGSFVAAIPAPLGIGTMELADGSSVKGFICEPAALDNARDITGYGGWTAYLAAKI